MRQAACCWHRRQAASPAPPPPPRPAAAPAGPQQPSCRRRRPRVGAAAPGVGPRTSLVPETLAEMEGDAELQATMAALAARGQAALTREEAAARRRSLQGLGLPGFAQKLRESGVEPLRRGATTTLQINVGLYCNQACSHCHVESSPARKESMDAATAQRCLQLLADSEQVGCLDLTGGAPELNAQFRPLVAGARALMGPSLEIIDRCNLTVLLEPGQEDLPQFLAQHRVRVVASLPCYGQDNVDKQRGRGVFDRSIEGLRLLNAAGYGRPGSGLSLDLVYNPGGAFLAPPQAKLEPVYRQELEEAYGVSFSSLLCLNNMPIKRFADWLVRRGELPQYMRLLAESFNAEAASGLMCRGTLSVSWEGRLFDCDFNQQLDLPIRAGGGGGGSTSEDSAAQPEDEPEEGQRQHGGEQGQQGGRRPGGLTLWDIDSLDDVAGLLVATGSHCYGCTAGCGSGCQGATAAAGG